jgi:dephospho-CoA kinase
MVTTGLTGEAGCGKANASQAARKLSAMSRAEP